jgi:hypothetical protein
VSVRRGGLAGHNSGIPELPNIEGQQVFSAVIEESERKEKNAAPLFFGAAAIVRNVSFWLFLITEERPRKAIDCFVERGDKYFPGVAHLAFQFSDPFRGVHAGFDVALCDRLPGEIRFIGLVPGDCKANTPLAVVALDADVSSLDGIPTVKVDFLVTAGDTARWLLFEELPFKLHPKIVQAVELDIDLILRIFGGLGFAVPTEIGNSWHN